MTVRHAQTAVAILLSTLPAVGAAFDWNGRVGLRTDRDDTWAASTPASTRLRLDVDLRLDVSGDIASPNIFAWRGGVGYRYQTLEADGTRIDKTTPLVYELGGDLLSYRGSPLKVSGFARRDDSRTENASSILDSTATTYGGRVALHSNERPDLAVGYTHIANEQRIDSVLNHARTTNLVSTQLTHGIGGFSLSANYLGEFNSGTWTTDENQTHDAFVMGLARFGEGEEILVSDKYYRRIPTTTAAGAYASEINAFNAGFSQGAVRIDKSSLRYSDSRATTTLDGLSDEALTNSLRFDRDQRLDPTWYLRGFGDLSATRRTRTIADPAAGALTSLSSRGATVGAEFVWYRRIETEDKIAPGVHDYRAYEVAAGPTVGVLEPEGGSARLGHGASAHGRIDVPWGARRFSTTYGVSYGSDLYGQAGWRLTQTAAATVAGAAGIGRYDMTLDLSAQRSWDPVGGAAASRAVTGSVNYGYFRYTLSGRASLSEGVLPGTSAFVGDGLFIPVGFDTRQTDVSLTATASILSALSVQAFVGYSLSVGPGQPDTSRYDTGGILTYRFAALELAIEERLSRFDQSALSGTGSVAYSRNALMVKLSRAFGSRY